MSDLRASRPTRFMSSPWPAMPMTRVAKMSGAMSDLIIRRKIVESGLRLVASSGASHPTSAPITMEIRIHLVTEMLRR